MFKRIFRLFQIARKLSTSGAIDTINHVHQIPLPINLFFNLISVGSEKNRLDKKRIQVKNYVLRFKAWELPLLNLDNF